MLAAICCTELLGPVRFDGFDSEGNPVGAPAYTPLVQIAAISDSQADNTMVLCAEMLAEGEAINYYDVDIMLSKITAPGARKLEKVTASPRGREGNRATFIVMDETHLWVPAEKGPELADALRRNAAKMSARTIETTNAPVPGEGSVAEMSHNAYDMMMAGETFDQALLFDTREVYVPNIYDREAAFPALEEVYGDAARARGGWVDLERIWAEINDPNTREHVARRFYFNQRVEGHSSWLKVEDWQACHCSKFNIDPQNFRLIPGQGFSVGFKGAIRNGAAALVACRHEDNALFLLGLWEKPENAPPDWEVPYNEVDVRARKLLGDDNCWKLVADPEYWQEIVGRWAGDFEDKVEQIWLTKNKSKAAAAVEQFESAVKQRRIKWADPNINRHVTNCHVEEVPQGFLIRKETQHSPRYISIAQAAVLALEAAVLSIEEGALRESDGGVLWSY